MTQPTLTTFLFSADALAEDVAGMTDAPLDQSLAPGEWSIRQIVHHLSDDCDVWCMAMKKAIATPGVMLRFEGFPGNDAWAAALDFAHRPIDAPLALILAHRHVMAQLVEQFPNAWDQQVIIGDADGDEVGRASVGDMVGFLGEHMQEHLEVIRAIKTASTNGQRINE
jgi:hypothetical protein